MFKKITYKRKFQYLLISGTLMFILAYKVAISMTLKTVQNLKFINSKLSEIEVAPANIALIEEELNSINRIIGENPGLLPDFQKNLFEQISSYCAANSLILKEFPQVHSWQSQNYQFLTGYANIEGPFIPLLKLLNQIEVSNEFGRILSVKFYSTVDNRTKLTRLTLSIYIQTFKQTNNGQSD